MDPKQKKYIETLIKELKEKTKPIRNTFIMKQEIKVIIDDLISEVIRRNTKRSRSDSIDTVTPGTPKRLRVPPSSPEFEYRIRTTGGWLVSHGKDYPGSPYIRFEEDPETPCLRFEDEPRSPVSDYNIGCGPCDFVPQPREMNEHTTYECSKCGLESGCP